MEAASIAHAEHHGPPPAHQSSRVNAPTLGMMLFIISEIMIFGAFFTAYFFIRVVNHDPWPAQRRAPARGCGGDQYGDPAVLVADDPLGAELDQARQPVRAQGRDGGDLPARPDVPVVQINEYVHIGFAPHDSAQATVFYALTGLHGCHVFIGLCLLLLVSIRSFRGHYSAEQPPRHGSTRDLLALRRPDVGGRLHDRLRALARRAVRICDAGPLAAPEPAELRGGRVRLPGLVRGRDRGDRGGRAGGRGRC